MKRHRGYKRRRSISSLMLSAALQLIVSPAVMVADTLKPNRSLRKAWVFYYVAFCILTLLTSWFAVLYSDYRTDRAIGALAEFSSGRATVKGCPYAAQINFYAIKYNVDPSLIAAIIKQESGFNPEAVSPKGARGLMQIMPGTWRHLNPTSRCRGDHAPPACGDDCIFSPSANIKAGTKHMRELLDRYNGNVVVALAAYNAGSDPASKYANVEEFDGLPPYKETQGYARSIASMWVAFRSQGELALAKGLVLATRAKVWLMWLSIGTWIVFLAWIARRTA
ncbi:MAG TPA: lytic transglycosylase domain-containing protein [Firmicutes bacterium]|nr:lytic transglycosylase domain-containing protein [Bacillota bacterium]